MIRFDRKSVTEIHCDINMLNNHHFKLIVVDQLDNNLPNAIEFPNLKKTTKLYDIAQYIQNNLSLYEIATNTY